MVIACNKCQTRFHVDDARVPDGGIKVRCSRCKHAFFVRKPDVLPDDEAHALAAAALESPAPEPSLDLAGSTEPPQGAEPTADEDEWQFAIDPPDAAASRAPEADPVEDPVAREPEPPPTPRNSLADRAKKLRADAKLADTESSSLADLASPESWDLVAGNDGALAPAAPAPSPAPAEGAPAASFDEAFPAVEAEPEDSFEEPDAVEAPPAARSGEAVESDSIATATASAAWEGGEMPSFERPTARRPRRRASASSFGPAVRVAGWVVLAGLLGAIGVGLARPASPGARTLGSLAIAGLEARGVRARFVENALAGPMLVVTGSLMNPGSEAAVPRGAVRVSLLDTEGRPVPQAALAGLPVDDARLRLEDPEQISEELVRSAAHLARRRFGPGEVVPFQAVVPDPAARAASLRLDPVAAPPLPRPAPVRALEPGEDDEGASPQAALAEDPAGP